MASILVCYGTGEGQTAMVTDRIADELAAHGHEVTTLRAKEADTDLDDFDAVLVGASIHYGRHQKAVRRFASSNREALAAKPTGFFQVSGSSGAGTEEGAAEAAGYVDEFVEATDWRPDRIGLFGGALRFSEYGFFMRAMMKRIAKSAYPDADTSGDVEFTDWESVDAFSDDFATFVEERLAGVA